MAWTISYTDSARKQLRKLDQPTARPVVDFLDGRIATLADPRSSGEAFARADAGRVLALPCGRYRIICDIRDGVLCVLAIEIGNRREISR